MAESFYLERRNKGYCTMLKGKALMYFVLISDIKNRWNQTMMDNFEIQTQIALRKLKKEALNYGERIECHYVHRHVSIKNPLSKYEGKYNDVMKMVKDNQVITIKEINKKYHDMGYDQVAVYYVYPYSLRANASSSSSANSYDEYANLGYDTKANTIIHETLHLFGAIDLYFPQLVKEQAQIYLKDSIMERGEHVDSFNAYMVGWCDSFDHNALAFYNNIKHMSYSQYEAALNAQWGIKNVDQNYNGDTKDGMKHGYGTYRYTNGDVYRGNWEMDKKEGMGRYEYHDGTIYDGEFHKDLFDGYGTMYYKDGSKYLGYFKKGILEGKGTMYYADGCVYDGMFKQNQIHGKGIYYDGKQIYEGVWEKGKYVKER